MILSHHSHIWVAETRLGTQDLQRHRYLIAAPLYHMNALALSKLAAVGHSTIVMLPQFEARAYITAIERHRCTMLTAVPPMIAMMLREADLVATTDLSSVEIIRMGSAPVSQALMSAIKQTFPKAQVVNAYGTTEAGPVVFGPHPQGLAQPEMSVGYAHAKVELRLVDGDRSMAPAPRRESIDQSRAGRHRPARSRPRRPRDEMPRGDVGLSQPPRPEAAVHC